MRFSIVNGEKKEAEKGLLGICIGCAQAMIPKCGPIKVHHWAHKSKCECDRWWENETEWHRSWKSNFPVEWQEVRHKSETGEWHIADVKTSQGYIIEFQHSFLNQQERQSRNHFYGSHLIWVVDGTTRKNDRAHFDLALKASKQIHAGLQLFQLQPSTRECSLLRDWSESAGVVFFDFGKDFPLWCLLPESSHRNRYLLPYSRQNFVALHKGLLNGHRYSDLERYLLEIVLTYEDPQHLRRQQFAIRNVVTPRQAVRFSTADARALSSYLNRPPPGRKRKFRF